MSPLSNQIAFELRQGCEHVKDEFTRGAVSADLFGDTLEPDASVFELSDDPNEIRKAPPKSVESPNDERVTITERSKTVLQLRSVGRLAGHFLFVGRLATSSLERITLQVQVQVVGRDAGVSDTLIHEQVPYIDFCMGY